MFDGRISILKSHVMGFKTSSETLWADLQVKVPPLGESITDGSVAAVLKQEGDTVEEDDPLIQIETDKVTVDVRSPVAGVVKSILVQADETVHVDNVVAVVKEGEAAGKAEGKVPVADTPKKETVVSSAPADSAAPSSPPADAGEGTKTHAVGHGRPVSAAPGAYVPQISFPTRRTADGRVISELSAEEQMIIRNDELAAKKSVHFFMAKRQVERPPLPPRRELSDKEMETVMLGGAE
jgi:2-oxoglutarate dehydrogenase E2 component (dihydrolipoamide succinyltransferase)